MVFKTCAPHEQVIAFGMTIAAFVLALYEIVNYFSLSEAEKNSNLLPLILSIVTILFSVGYVLYNVI